MRNAGRWCDIYGSRRDLPVAAHPEEDRMAGQPDPARSIEQLISLVADPMMKRGRRDRQVLITIGRS